MGVRGLKSFLEREKQCRTVNIGDEINKWKTKHPNQTAIIVIDFLSLANCVSKKLEDVICGGRHKIAMDFWINILNTFTATGAKLVFFSDLNIQVNKIEEWMNRRDEDHKIYTDLYDRIDAGQTLAEIISQKTDFKALSSTFYGMAIIAQNYGEFNYCVRHECDLELAKYAKKENAVAVITNDTDFLIFEGPWKFWSSQEIKITPSNQLETVEYNRGGIAKVCALSQHQLPLFATLLANDFTHSYYNQLSRFASGLGPLKYKFQNIARYVRQKFSSKNLSNRDIQSIAHNVFGYSNDEIVDLIKESLKSYNVNFSPAEVSDPLELKLMHTNMYRPYMSNMCSIHGLTTSYYDNRGCEEGKALPILLIDWVKRRKGVLRQQKSNRNIYSFILLAKTITSQDYMDTEELPIYPEFLLPPLEQLYLNATDDTIDIRWKIAGWIMSIHDDVMSTLKQIPKNFLLICTALYCLIEFGLITIEQADGILYTEYKVYANETLNIGYPTALVTQHVRAAHIYNISFSHVRQNFAIAGLGSYVMETIQFDGVYFQKLMEKLGQMNAGEREIFLTPIKKYRIYTK